MTTTKAPPVLTDRALRGVRIVVAERLVSNFLTGKVTGEQADERLKALSPHDQPGPYFVEACEAYETWMCAETGDVEIARLAPDLAHPEVYAERCRVLLDEALEALCGGPR